MSDDMHGRIYFSSFFEKYPPDQWLRPSGLKHVASFDQKIDKLEIRRGRLCVSVGGMWHIVPDPNE